MKMMGETHTLTYRAHRPELGRNVSLDASTSADLNSSLASQLAGTAATPLEALLLLPESAQLSEDDVVYTILRTL